MKNKIILVFLFALGFTSFSLSAQAYDPYYPGSTLNPLQIEIIPKTGDRLDALIQQQTQDRILQQQYQYQQQLLDIQRQQLKLQQNQQYQQQFRQQSETTNQACQKYYGVYSTWGGTRIGQSPVCSCVTGYQWNSEKTACVVAPVAPVKTNDQICKDYYGVNSAWTNTLGTSGEAICDCKTGYQWDSNRMSCIFNTTPLIPGCDSNEGYSATSGISCGEVSTVATTMCNGKEWLNCSIGQTFYCPPTSGDAQCIPKPETRTITSIVVKKTPEIKNTQKVTKENTSNVIKIEPVKWDKVIVVQESPKPKTGWVRIKGWFGF